MLFGLAVHPVTRGNLATSPLLEAAVSSFVIGIA
jgi:hypothetical protein